MLSSCDLFIIIGHMKVIFIKKLSSSSHMIMTVTHSRSYQRHLNVCQMEYQRDTKINNNSLMCLYFAGSKGMRQCVFDQRTIRSFEYRNWPVYFSYISGKEWKTIFVSTEYNFLRVIMARILRNKTEIQ
jgi:hypothetical protein